MIAKLKGILDAAIKDYLILDVNGVGYQVHVSNSTRSRVGKAGDPVTLFIETNVREDAITLYGFLEAFEQEWFQLLYSVQGVGPKAALAILSVFSPEKLGMVIASGDQKALTQADGVGPKLATRIATELKDKAGTMSFQPSTIESSSVATTSSAALSSSANDSENGDVGQDAVSALVNLGYARADAYSAVLQAKSKSNDNSSLSEIIKLALKELGAGA